MNKMIEIHLTIYLFGLLSILMGTYKEFIILFVLIGIHESGHFLCAKLLKVPVEKIVFYPLGGLTKLKMDFNEKPWKEFFILLAGPLFQIGACSLLCKTSLSKEIIQNYHYGILTFNLLPIYPLDGGRLLNILLNYVTSFKKAFQLSIVWSYIITIWILFQNTKFSMNMIMIYIVLIVLIRKEHSKENIYFQKFLLERYLNDYYFGKDIIVKDEKGFYKQKNNWVKENSVLINEKDYLRRKYHPFS